VIGAPGSLDRRGSIHKNKVVKSLFDDDSRWYDDPAVDDLPEQHPTLDDYLGADKLNRSNIFCCFYLSECHNCWLIYLSNYAEAA